MEHVHMFTVGAVNRHPYSVTHTEPAEPAASYFPPAKLREELVDRKRSLALRDYWPFWNASGEA